MKSKGHFFNRFNLSSGIVLLLALAFIGCSCVYLVYAYQQPSDGWLYESRIDGQMIAATPLIGKAGPLQPGDIVLEIDGLPVATIQLRPIKPPAGWQAGGTAKYTIQRGDKTINLEVPLIQRSFDSLMRFYYFNRNSLPTYLFWYLIAFGVFFLRPRETAAKLLLLFITYWTTIDAIISADTTLALNFYPTGLFYWSTILNGLWLMMFAMIIHFLLVFPLHKWPLTIHPRLSLWLLYGISAIGTFLTMSLAQIVVYNVVLGFMVLLVIITLFTSTFHNFRHLHDPVVRAQVGWVVLGISAPILAGLIGFVLPSFFPDLSGSYINAIWSLASILLPLCLGIAITRYRLFDIAIIIRRTLQYGLLSVVLGLAYFGMVLLMEQIFQVITGQESPLAVVFSTLIIAALFNPLRRGIQNFIDKRFFRNKYNSELAVAKFSEASRSEVETEILADKLVVVVSESVQPENISIWLKKESS